MLLHSWYSVFIRYSSVLKSHKRSTRSLRFRMQSALASGHLGCRCIVQAWHNALPPLLRSGGLPPECSPSEAAPPESPTSVSLVAAAVLEASPARPAPPSEPTTAPPIEPTSDGTSDLTISEYLVAKQPVCEADEGAPGAAHVCC